MKPNFRDGYPFSKHLFAVEIGKTEIKMTKPLYLGQAILDLSKTLIVWVSLRLHETEVW